MKNKGISGMRIGFDNDRYLKIQSEHIKERINQFGDKLYLEFGGKLHRTVNCKCSCSLRIWQRS